MPIDIIYYGGKKIVDSKIIEEIAKLSESENIYDDVDAIIMEFPTGLISEKNGKKETIHLVKEDAKTGGEGVVFRTNKEGFVAKIYFKKMRSNFRRDKIRLMVDNPINDNSICWPCSLLMSNKEFVGFLMPLISESYVIKDPFDYSVDELSSFFKYDKRNVIKVLINIMCIFEKLKSNNIVMGDINFNNFMINKNTYEVILIDLDGAQIDKYPCVTCKAYFNAPELFSEVTDYEDNEECIANKHYHSYYSTFLRDSFGLAAYSFMLLMKEKPYNGIECLAKFDFGYDVSNVDKTIANKNETYSNRWAHLPLFMREAFYKCFTTKNPNERLTPKQWCDYLRYYLKLLENGEIKKYDNDCLVIYKHDRIDYSIINISLKKYLNLSGFTINDVVKRLVNDAKKDGIEINVDYKMISEYLKHNRIMNYNNMFKFKVLFNIGVYKKIALEYKSS